MAKKKSATDKKRAEAKKNLDARREAGTLRSADVSDPLLGWDAQQGVRPASEKPRLYKDDPVVYSDDQLPRNRPEIVPEEQRGKNATPSDGGPQTANVDPGEVENAEKSAEKAREEEEKDNGGEKKVVKKSSSKK